MIHCLLIVGPDRFSSAMRMLKSIDDVQVKVYVLWRGYDSIPILANVDKPYFETVLPACSVSAGRNRLLVEVLRDEFVPETDIVCLADDDGYWSEDLTSQIISTFEERIPWALGIYGPETGIDRERFSDIPNDSLSLKQLIRRGSSLGIYSTVGLIRKVGFFDESLGLGTSIPIGEDTDFIIRLARGASSSHYRPNLLQWHPYANVFKKSRMIDSLNLFLHFRSKGYSVGTIYLQRVFGLLLRNVLSPQDALKYLAKWVVRDSNPRPGA